MKSKRSSWALGALLLGAALLPGTLSAQSALDTAQAQAFLGNWTISMQTDMGPFAFGLAIADQAGKVAATMNSPELGGNQSITDITRSEAYLVLAFTADAQGQQFPVTLSLEPNGDALDVYFDVADGMFSATGTATRAAS
jgi:hypothetical protein